jgi:hypothetical protein
MATGNSSSRMDMSSKMAVFCETFIPSLSPKTRISKHNTYIKSVHELMDV